MISRRALIGFTLAGLAAVCREALAGYAGGLSLVGSGAGGSSLTTRTLVNNSGSTMNSGTVTPRFGQSFKPGDIPPIIKTTGNISSGSATLSSLASTTGM